MPRKVFTFIILAIACQEINATQPAQNPGDAERAALTELFTTYTTAIAQREGRRAADCLAQDSLLLYHHYRDAALAGQSYEIQRLPLVHQNSILMLRATIPPKELKEKTPKDIYATLISRGLIAHQWSHALSLASITMLKENQALLEINIRSQPAIPLIAVKEQGQWKLSLRETLEITNEAILLNLQDKNLSPEEYLTSILTQKLGPERARTVWVPPAVRIKKAIPTKSKENVAPVNSSQPRTKQP